MVLAALVLILTLLVLGSLAPTLGCVASTPGNPGTCGANNGVASLTNSQTDRPNLPEQANFVYGDIGLSLLFDSLLIPAALALYFALNRTNKSAMILAPAFLGAYIVLDLGVAVPSLYSLLTLSQNYLTATSVGAQTAIAASMSSTWNVWWLSSVRGFFEYAGVLLASAVMLRGVFRKPVAYVGVVASAAGIVQSFGVIAPNAFYINVLFLVSYPLFAIWLVLAGARLYRLSRG
jgi:hypothetical protein